MTYPLYSDLKKIANEIDFHITSWDNKALFLTAFSALYLLEDPLFEFDVQNKRSIQTFYANHYLKESLCLDCLPNKEILKNYFYSDAFRADLCNLHHELSLNHQCDGVNNVMTEKISVNEIFKQLKFICESIFITGKLSVHVSPHSQPSDIILQNLKDDGYYVFNNFFQDNYFHKLKQATISLASNEANGKGYFYGQNEKNQRIYNLISKDNIFVEFLNCPFMHNLCNQYFDRPTFHDKFGMNSFSANIIHGGGSEGAWHIDSVLPDPIPTEYPIRLQIIISIDEFTIDNGSTAVVPKSHKLGRRPTANDYDLINQKQKTICCPAGSMLIFDSSLWHKNTKNKTNESRHSLLASFAASYFMEVCGEEEHLSIVPQKLLCSLPDRLQSMLGYKRAIKKGALIY